MSDYEQSGEPVKNKYEVGEIEFIQQEIQAVTKKIEHAKITLRISNERYEKQMDVYSKLQGKPSFIKQEQKEKEKEKEKDYKERRDLSKSPPKGNQTKVALEAEHMEMKRKQLNKRELELELLTKEINEVNLENRLLKKEIANIRKEKEASVNQLNSINETNERLKSETASLKHKNKDSKSQVPIERFTRTTRDGFDLKRDFEDNRDKLEGKYHEIIEGNIRRERERKKEQARARQMVGMKALSIIQGEKKTAAASYLQDQLKQLENEELSDRTPILDVLINKWKYVNKYKKGMVEKYIVNSTAIKDAFARIMTFLGVDDYDELPIIYQKTEEQLSSIEIYISDLTNKANILEEKKKLLTEQINALSYKQIDTGKQKETFSNVKSVSINKLNDSIKELEDDIQRKREFFLSIQPETNVFLQKLGETYIADYVPAKVPIDDNLKYTETNISDIIDNVENYNRLIVEFERSVVTSNEDASNRELEKMRNEMKMKLEMLKKETCINNNFYTTLKNDTKGNNNMNFDDTLKKLADTIVNQVSSSTGFQIAKNKQSIHH